MLKSYTPKKIVERLIQYNYKTLNEEYNHMAQNKILGRLSCNPNDPKAMSQSCFWYDRLDLEDTALAINLLYYPSKSEINMHAQGFTTFFLFWRLQTSKFRSLLARKIFD